MTLSGASSQTQHLAASLYWGRRDPEHAPLSPVAGALVGSAVGDALGAPLQFGPAGQFTARFSLAARGAKTEMCGGGSLGWGPGEFADDTQMALLVAESLVECGALDEADLFSRFRTWLEAGPADVATRPAPCSAPDCRGTSRRPSTSHGPDMRRPTAR
jgi:hypothetical protein